MTSKQRFILNAAGSDSSVVKKAENSRFGASLLARRLRRTSKDSSPKRIIRLVPAFILETNNQTNYKCLPKFVQTDNAQYPSGRIMLQSSIKTVIDCHNPYLVKHIKSIESVQRRATRVICGSEKEYQERLGVLKWPSLEL